MKTFAEIRFPADISYGISGGPEYSTDVVITSSGYEQRNINWPMARNKYNAAHGVKTKAQLEELMAFFRARKGKAIGFRFKDWLDYQASDQKIGEGDGKAQTFQLIKEYQSGEAIEKRIIKKPVKDTLQVFLDKKLITKGFEVDWTQGIITFAPPPAMNIIITANFEFDVPVRFDTDRLSAMINDYGSYSWQDIPLIEVRI